jgi:uncharacterized membrane protein YagU involved in acid resistance
MRYVCFVIGYIYDGGPNMSIYHEDSCVIRIIYCCVQLSYIVVYLQVGLLGLAARLAYHSISFVAGKGELHVSAMYKPWAD